MGGGTSSWRQLTLRVPVWSNEHKLEIFMKDTPSWVLEAMSAAGKAGKEDLPEIYAYLQVLQPPQETTGANAMHVMSRRIRAAQHRGDWSLTC